VISPALAAVFVLIAVILIGIAGWRARVRRGLAAQLPTRTDDVCRSIGATSTFVRLDVPDAVRLHVVVAGPENGPLAVLLHGFPECWHAWRRQIGWLASLGYRVVAPDQRGYGLSDKPAGISSYAFDVLVEDVCALVRAVGHTSAVVVGHDWGGAVAWKVAMDRPEVVRRLVIMNAPHPFAFARALRHDLRQVLRIWYMVFFQLPLLPEAFIGFSPRFSAKFYFHDNAFQKEAFGADDHAFLASNFAQAGALTTMVNWYRAAVWDPPAKPTVRIDVPTLMLWAEDDVALGVGLTEGLEPWVPNLELQLVAECGHWVQNEQPDVVNDAMTKFLAPLLHEAAP
jgi:pimeloyl-ACP methyl ester carboxylesterase